VPVWLNLWQATGFAVSLTASFTQAGSFRILKGVLSAFDVGAGIRNNRCDFGSVESGAEIVLPFAHTLAIHIDWPFVPRLQFEGLNPRQLINLLLNSLLSISPILVVFLTIEVGVSASDVLLESWRVESSSTSLNRTSFHF
jgi:hypothetical protein